MLKTEAEKKEYFKNHKLIANREIIEQFFIIEPHHSEKYVYQSERLTTKEQDRQMSVRRKSEDLRTSG